MWHLHQTPTSLRSTRCFAVCTISQSYNRQLSINTIFSQFIFGFAQSEWISSSVFPDQLDPCLRQVFTTFPLYSPIPWSRHVITRTYCVHAFCGEISVVLARKLLLDLIVSLLQFNRVPSIPAFRYRRLHSYLFRKVQMPLRSYWLCSFSLVSSSEIIHAI